MIDSIIKLTLKTVKPQKTSWKTCARSFRHSLPTIPTTATPQNLHTARTETSHRTNYARRFLVENTTANRRRHIPRESAIWQIGLRLNSTTLLVNTSLTIQ